jgi:hypothetical protein
MDNESLKVGNPEYLDAQVLCGALTKFRAARKYINVMQLCGERVRLRVPQGGYVTRKLVVPARSIDPAWVFFHQQQCAVVWKDGELAIDL